MVHLVQVRADAQRNRARILDAARELVAVAGADVTMEVIAGRAGVAVGTLYRHFPAKEDLVAAVVEDSVTRIAELAERAVASVEAGADPGEQVGELFAAVAERHATDRAIKAAARSVGGARVDTARSVGGARVDTARSVGGDSPSEDYLAAPPGSPTARAVGAITALLDRARAAGAVRPDVTLADLVMLLGALPGEEGPQQRRRYVEIVLAGLTARPPTGPT